MSDGDLVRLTLGGRPDAYEQLVRRWAGRITAVCHARVGRFDQAEELAQETLYRGFKALATLQEPDRFGGWLCGIATRVCLDHLKSRRRVAAHMDDESAFDQLVDDRSDEPSAAIERDEQISELMKEVRRLPLKLRETLMLYYQERRTYDELGAMLGVSSAAINLRLTQARQLLRERLMARQNT